MDSLIKAQIVARFDFLTEEYFRWFENSPFADDEGMNAEQILSFYEKELPAKDAEYLWSFLEDWSNHAVYAEAMQTCPDCNKYKPLFKLEERDGKLYCDSCRARSKEAAKTRQMETQLSLF